jgi:hypothetical protein
MKAKNKRKGPKLLVLDIETSPIITYNWAMFDQVTGLGQIKEDWYVLSFAAKWIGEKKVIYADQRNKRDISNDKDLLKQIWNLLNSCDILISQNGTSFDVKKLNARFIMNGFPPPSNFKNIDTYTIAKKKFKFTSNKLEYMADKINKKYKKLKHTKYPGLELWKAVLKGDKQAWRDMEKYNKYDVLATEELYTNLIPWDSSINFSLYHDSEDHICSCGSTQVVKNGFHYTSAGKFQRYKCSKCGRECRDRTNLFSKEKKKSIKAGLPR